MPLDPKRTVAELAELRALTGDENGAQRVAWTDTWLKAREWFRSSSQASGGAPLRRGGKQLGHAARRVGEGAADRRPS